MANETEAQGVETGVDGGVTRDFPIIQEYEKRVGAILGPHNPTKLRIDRTAFEWFNPMNFENEGQEEFLVFLLETENNPRITEFRTQVENINTRKESRPWEQNIKKYTPQELIYMYYYMAYSQGGRALDEGDALEVIKNELITRKYPSPATYPKVYPVATTFHNK